jgi:hypothetical protein
MKTSTVADRIVQRADRLTVTALSWERMAAALADLLAASTTLRVLHMTRLPVVLVMSTVVTSGAAASDRVVKQ